jgi:hypothetical protein
MLSQLVDSEAERASNRIENTGEFRSEYVGIFSKQSDENPISPARSAQAPRSGPVLRRHSPEPLSPFGVVPGGPIR